MRNRLLGVGRQVVGSGILLGMILLAAEVATAQIEPDDSLGSERSQITRDREIRGGRADQIEGGARRGNNLFHSFRDFNIGNDQRVYFANPAGVETIFSRVTGSNASNILGTLGVDGAANLFLLNPNGLIFGRNAQLDIRGSFVGTTADAIGFGENFFSATNPEVPSSLLNIEPSAFFFNRFPTGGITVQSATPINPDLNTAGLQVGAGENLALLGGAITVAGGGLNAPGGRIDLGAVASPGTVGLSSNGFVFPADLQRGSVSFTDAAKGDVRTRETGGAITITAQRIGLTGGSTLFAGLLSRQNPQISQAGNITLNANGQVLMSQGSLIENRVFRDAPGNSGDIEVNTPILEVLEGARLITTTNGRGNAGNLQITASDRVTFQGTSGSGEQQVRSGALSLVARAGNGNGGDIQINTPILEVLDGAELTAEVFGRGNSGRVLATVSDRAIFRGESRDRLLKSRAVSLASRETAGNANNIEITTPILEILDGAELSTTTVSQGAVGDVIITASERVTVQGVGTPNEQDPFRRSSITAEFFGSDSGTSGTSGNIRITTPVLEVLDGAQLNVNTSRGNAGTIRVLASDRVTFQGTGISGSSPLSSNALSSVTETGRGNGGNLEITTPVLEVLDGARLLVSTFGQGSAGNIRITADRAIFQGVSLEGVNSAVLSTVDSRSQGNGGNIEINASVLELRGGAEVAVSTDGQGNAGSLLIGSQRASERVVLVNRGSLSARSTSLGEAGNLTVNARNIILRNDSAITATNQSSRGGNIRLAVTSAQLNDSQISASTATGRAGNLQLNASRTVQIDNRSRLSVEATAGGVAGSLGVRTDQLNLQNRSQISVSSRAGGAAGSLAVTAQQLRLADRARIVAETEAGAGGDLALQIADTVRLEGNSTISASTSNGQGGRLTVNQNRNPANLIVLNQSQMTAEASAQGNAGDLNLNTRRLSLQGEAAAISASSNAGSGGDINLQNLERLAVDASEITASTETGRAGNVRVNATEAMDLTNRGRIAVEATGSGRAGNLAIVTGELSLVNGTATVSSRQGQAGNLAITADSVRLDQGRITAETAVSGRIAGANIRLSDLDVLSLRNGSQISANAGGAANGGNVTIGSDFIFARLTEDSNIRANAIAGNGGNISITTDGLFGIQPADTPTIGISDITASSERGIQGNVEINTPNPNPTQGLEFSDAPSESLPLAQNCSPTTDLARQRSSFVVVGRGGLPPSPYEALGSEDLWQDWRLGEVEPQGADNRSAARVSGSESPELIEAQGWMRNRAGQVELVAIATTAQPNSLALAPANCATVSKAASTQSGEAAE